MIRSLELPKLPKVFNIPPSIQKYLKPMLMASLGLHVFALLVPLPADQLNQKSHRPKTVRLTSRPIARKTLKTIPKSPPPVKALPKVRVVALSQKGLVIPSPPKKRVAKLAAPPKGKPPTEKKPAEKPQPEKKQAQSKPPSPPSGKKAPVPPAPPAGNPSSGMDDFLQNIVASLSENTDVTPDLFSAPTEFFPNYKKPSPNDPPGFDVPPDLADGIEDQRLISGKTPSEVYQDVLPSISPNGYTLGTPTEYGGGQLYKITKAGFTSYLNIVPTENKKGTIIVTWSKDPSN